MSAVCLCGKSIVAMKQEKQDQGGRKGLRGGLGWRKEKKTRRETWRSNPQEPEVRASSQCKEQLRGE